MTCDEVSLVKFQSYQFRQINPDDVSELEMRAKVAWAFQSYQFRQINPDDINTKPVFVPSKAFQSYQFRQINPDFSKRRPQQQLYLEVSIVSIQADQSRLSERNLGITEKKLVSIVSIHADQSRPC